MIAFVGQSSSKYPLTCFVNSAYLKKKFVVFIKKVLFWAKKNEQKINL